MVEFKVFGLALLGAFLCVALVNSQTGVFWGLTPLLSSEAGVDSRAEYSEKRFQDLSRSVRIDTTAV